MPPKKSSAPAPKGKTEEKKKAKVLEDKTFGMKNKKGAQTQKVIDQMKKQVAGSAKAARAVPEQPKSKKELEKEKQAELASIFKPVPQSVGSKVDPKSVLCMFFKQGLCTKGDKCKFSHDLSVGAKAEKRSIYFDERDPGEDDNMDDWDEQKLEEVVQQKHGESEKNKLKTAIICKHFLQAVEEGKYGWFWQCPNGNDKCLYRHALPSGYVLAKDRKKKEEEKITLEELIERERAALGNELTKVTWQTFRSWKERKRKENAEREQVELEKKKSEFQSGKAGALSGRELFAFNPSMVTGDDDMEAVDSSAYMREVTDADADVVVKEWTKEALEYEGEYDTADDTGATVATSTKREGLPYAGASTSSTAATTNGGPSARRMPRDQTADYRDDDAVRNGNDAASDDDGDDDADENDNASEASDDEYERVNLDDVDVEFFENEPEEAIMQAMEELAVCDDPDAD